MKKILLLLITTMLLATSCVIQIGIGVNTYENADKYSVMIDSQTIETDITELNLNWQTGTVDILLHDEDYVLISETGNSNLTSDSRLHYYLDGTKLKLQFAKSGFSAGSSFKKDLIIKLPRTTKLAKFVINNAASDIKFADISADNVELQIAAGKINGNFITDITKFSLDAASGDVKIDSKNVESLAIDSASGVLNFTGEYIKKVSLDAASGNHFITSTEKAIDSLILNKTSGTTKIYIPENDGFVVKYSKITGNISSTFNTSKSRNEIAYGNKSRVYEVNITSGDVRIYKIAE